MSQKQNIKKNSNFTDYFQNVLEVTLKKQNNNV